MQVGCSCCGEPHSNGNGGYRCECLDAGLCQDVRHGKCKRHCRRCNSEGDDKADPSSSGPEAEAREPVAKEA